MLTVTYWANEIIFGADAEIIRCDQAEGMFDVELDALLWTKD